MRGLVLCVIKLEDVSTAYEGSLPWLLGRGFIGPARAPVELDIDNPLIVLIK